jgi:hypothetical protein
MKKIFNVLLLCGFILVLAISVKSFAGRCEDGCISEKDSYCSLPYGDDGDITVCGGYTNYKTLIPFEPTIDDSDPTP